MAKGLDETASGKARRTGKWAVTMTKVRISQVLARTSWKLITFLGKNGGEAVGVVDLIAIRKDHRTVRSGTKRGDHLQIVLIQVKGGGAAMPTIEDGKRLALVAKRLNAEHILLASWKKGSAAVFSSYDPKASERKKQWVEVLDLDLIFR